MGLTVRQAGQALSGGCRGSVCVCGGGGVVQFLDYFKQGNFLFFNELGDQVALARLDLSKQCRTLELISIALFLAISIPTL